MGGFAPRATSTSPGTLALSLDTDATELQRSAPAKLTQRYRVVWQSLRQPPEGAVSISRAG